MQSRPAVHDSSETKAQCGALARSAKRRAYNREYMRAWRANPRHRSRERAAQQKAYFARKSREWLHERPPFTDDLGAPVCALCGRLPPVTEIARLRIRETRHGEYVQVRVPYCGQC